ncbi:MAG: putative oxidoreductase [Verrucomicrobia subdivision 3 bacterium]|nr:putative oxidoreductase [Limisphaerales bacterium]
MKLGSTIAAVVTGGASGLGQATATSLAAKGVKVALFDLERQAEKAEALANEIGGMFCPVDVSSEVAVDAAFVQARGAHGQERILVNCAGIPGPPARTASVDRKTGESTHYPIDVFTKVIKINLIGTFMCIAKAAAGMLTLDPLECGDRGAVVNTASAAAEDGQIGQCSYSASKAGVVGMTLPIARDLARSGIRVNTILPGLFKTPMLTAAPQETQDALASNVPFPSRLGEPSEYANLALNMIENGYFNGEDVRLDGAIRMPPR